jgi:hypothetical protein
MALHGEILTKQRRAASGQRKAKAMTNGVQRGCPGAVFLDSSANLANEGRALLAGRL